MEGWDIESDLYESKNQNKGKQTMGEQIEWWE